MTRVKRGASHLKRRKNVLKRVKGFRGQLKNLNKAAKNADTHAGMHAYRDRRRKKREFRGLWNIRINAAARAVGMTYSTLIGAMKAKEVGLDRKVLSEIAKEKPAVFEAVAKFVKGA